MRGVRSVNSRDLNGYLPRPEFGSPSHRSDRKAVAGGGERRPQFSCYGARRWGSNAMTFS